MSPSEIGITHNALGLLDIPISDPPPPYPSPELAQAKPRLCSIHPRGDIAQTRMPAQSLLPAHSPTPSFPSAKISTMTLTVDIFEALSDEHLAQLGADGQARNGPHCIPGLHKRALVRYFRPMGRKAYHAALFHLMVVNFPFALIAWTYLFVFTLTGTTLLITLPLGALLCFLDLLGARAFARGELALQTKFHGPLAYPPPYPHKPIFQRTRSPDREPSAAEIAATGVQYETSFYKNAYAMFTDATTYQALFYFLVIKPGITLCISMVLVVVVPVSYVLILPAPLMLRFVRRLGIWQANVAVEGLYYQVT
ncbi:hypothetical protein JVU11DRAFT_2857 [Chiua virens]|nr:hypothetical protein JVU11DRAFT_2857 [Chiua virens]